MPKTYRVALLGFSLFERSTLATYFRLAAQRSPRFELVSARYGSDFILADADDAASVQLVRATERLGETVFVGSQAPDGAVAWMMRPIDPLQVMRELDAMLLQRGGGAEPVAAKTTAAKTTAAPPVPAEQPPGLPQGPAALLVDDSPLALRFLASRLQPWGLAVECVSTSGKAVERLAQRNYEFVFIDVELGAESELDGLALCQHIKRQHRHVDGQSPVLVMVSAHHGQVDRARGAFAGCDHYLAKPADDAALRQVLRARV